MGNFLSYFSLIKLLTFKRVLNVVRIHFAHFTAYFTKRINTYFPYSITIEISSVCNLKCPQCPVGLGQIDRKKKFMEVSTADKILSQFASKGLILNLYFQGESMLHPNFFEIAAMGSQKKLFSILSTNATLINEFNALELVKTGIHRIIISIDGLDQKVYEKYRIGGQSDKVWESIKWLSDAKKKLKTKWPEIVAQTLVNKHNESSLSTIKKRAIQHGANKVNFKTMQLYHDHSNWLPSNQKFSRYEQTNLVRKPKNKCLRTLAGVVVSSDGEILPCCQDKQAKNSFGNIQNGFARVIKGDKREDFLNTIYFSKHMHSICRNCPEAMKVYKK
jgi:radical SAM protein with 4Fe4S-binding SPASM domain